MFDDRISGLPDELLHSILVGLGSAHAAARTSVLSRRWRHLWRHLPELDLDDNPDSSPPPPPASFLDSVDGALAGYSAPTLERLSISLSRDDDYDSHSQIQILPQRVAPWLRFAAERVAGKLCLLVPPLTMPPHGEPDANAEEEAVLELPVCERAKSIVLCLAEMCRVRLQPAGSFAALTYLMIIRGRMEGSELTALVRTRCPRLRELTLIVELAATSDVVSLRSGSLHSLVLFVRNARRIEVVAPRLEVLEVSHAAQAHISAPNLAEIDWHTSDAYNPLHHRFADAGRRLRVLKVGKASAVASLLQQFDEVDELDLEICIPQMHFFPLSCPCHMEENRKIDGTALNSLEEVEICGFTDSREKVELVELLSCNAAILKKLVINYQISCDAPLTKGVCAKVRSMCRLNVKVEFYTFLDGSWVRFD
ncbi:unnamed protein product [Urochloa decumbens]|uniref:FBD domain-containing protein n=1 Tax=Urochloa decumbens TaxID=240449 RepID=A0ABC9AMX7_9POAL